MTQLTGRAEQLVDALADAIISTAEAAAELIDLAARVAQIQQRMAAFGAVLESVGAMKHSLLTRLDDPSTPDAQRRLIEQQVNLLTAQESEILKRAGATPELAHQAIESADCEKEEHPDPLYRRDGRRFVPVIEETSASSSNNGG
jgi:uncharacterized protein YhaN